MKRLRGLSTVLGAVISIAAMLSVMAAAAYMLSVMGSTEARIAKLSSQRMNDLLEMYTSLVVNNTGTRLCFSAPNDRGLVKSIILLDGKKLKVVHGRCVRVVEARSARRIVLVSRNGALFQLDPRIVSGVNGSAPLYTLLTGTHISGSGTSSPVNILGNIISYLNSTLIAGRIYTSEINMRVYISDYISDAGFYIIGTRFVLKSGQKYTQTTLISPALYKSTVEIRRRMYEEFGWPPDIILYHTLYGDTHAEYYFYNYVLHRRMQVFDEIHMPLAMKLLKLDNDTACAVTILPLTLGTERLRVISLAACFRRAVIGGSHIVINSTLIWGGTPLAASLFSIVQKYGYAIVRLGPPGGLVPGFTGTASSNALIFMLKPGSLLDIGLESITKPFVEGNEINLAPLVYKPYVVDVAYATRWYDVKHMKYTANFTSIGRVIDGTLRPYTWIIWTPLAFYYTVLTGSNLPAPFFIPYGVPPYKLQVASLYQPGFLTYVEPAPGTRCQLVHLKTKPPLVDINGVERIPGLVCIKIGTYWAKITVYDAMHTEYLMKYGTPRIALRFEIPEDIVACYYPAELVCNGRVYIYYSFAPSTIFSDVYRNVINKFYDEMAKDWIDHPEYVNTIIVTISREDLLRFFNRLASIRHIEICGLAEQLYSAPHWDYLRHRPWRIITRLITPESDKCRLLLPGVSMLISNAFIHVNLAYEYQHKGGYPVANMTVSFHFVKGVSRK